MNINYCSAKTIIYSYRKKIKPILEENSSVLRCSFKWIESSDEKNAISIVSLIGGRLMNAEACSDSQKARAFFYQFEENKSFVEKFLLIKDIENELEKLNVNYLVEFEGGKAIFWFQQK